MLVYAIKLKKKEEEIYQQIHMYIDFEALVCTILQFAFVIIFICFKIVSIVTSTTQVKGH